SSSGNSRHIPLTSVGSPHLYLDTLRPSAPHVDVQLDDLPVILPADAVEAVQNALGGIVQVRAITPRRHADDPYSHRPVDRSSACGLCLPGDALLILPRLPRC